MASGLSIIQLSKQELPEPIWSELQEFSIVASGGLDKCFSNGFQQIPVIIKIETKSVEVDGKQAFIPVSDAELSTLRLVDKLSNAVVPFVSVAQEGIEYGSGISWAASKKRNRFKLYTATPSAQTLSPAVPAPQNNGVRYRELWIHLAAEGSRTFYAQFNSARGTFNSTDETGDNYEVTVQGVRPLPPPLSNYTLKRERVWQDPDGRDGPPTNSSPEGDFFGYYRQSIDYWRLSYNRLTAYPVRFATCLIEKNGSTIQWESELVHETFFSYTGCAFNPANFENSDSPAPEGLSFDPYFWGLMRLYKKSLSVSFPGGKRPAPGELIVSLHRTDDILYWYDKKADGDKRKLYRKHMDDDVKFVLLDEEGNRHSLSIGFIARFDQNITDSRNTLILSRT